jgi:hypothetical protein
MYGGEETIYRLSLSKTKGQRPLVTQRWSQRITLKLALKNRLLSMEKTKLPQDRDK